VLALLLGFRIVWWARAAASRKPSAITQAASVESSRQS
jgi:hypothetical protein